MKKAIFGMLLLTLLITTAVVPLVGTINIDTSHNAEKPIQCTKLPRLFPPWLLALINGDWDYWSTPPDLFTIPTGNVGIGTTNPSEKLDVIGTVQMTGFKMPTGAISGYVLTADATGKGTWQVAPGGAGGDTDWAWSSGSGLSGSIYHSGDVGIGTTTPGYKLHVVTSEEGPAVLVRNNGLYGVGIKVETIDDNGIRVNSGCCCYVAENTPMNGLYVINAGECGVRVDQAGQYAGYFNGKVGITGNLYVWGTKSFVQRHPMDPTKEIIYVSMEGPEAGTYIRGTTQLVDGTAVITLPEHFSLVTSTEGLTVQLTPIGSWLQLYVVHKDTTSIIIKEADGKNGEFDYVVQGVRKGYEDHQVIQELIEVA